jgi:hypothetical protein
MPASSHQATTPEQQKFVIDWLSVLDNRLSCFGGAGAKAGYGSKLVVKPSTAYNSLAQAVNKKFPGTSWDGDSAKSRVRTMKSKFHNVFSLCSGNVLETAIWKLSDTDKRDGILTLADKAQSMCPHWNCWLEWCGSDPNMTKHGAGESGLVASISASLSSESRIDAAGSGASGSDSCSDDDVAPEQKVSLAEFAQMRKAEGDEGHRASDGDEDGGGVPRAVRSTVDRAAGAPGGADDLHEQKRQRREMLAQMSPTEKKEFTRQEQKDKRQREQEASAGRRNVIAAAGTAATSSSSSALGSPTNTGGSSVSSPFGKGGNKDWQASFLADRAKDEDARSEKQAAAQVTVAKLHLDAADRQHAADQQHKREQLGFQQQQLSFQQQHMQMQMQMQQSQQMM